MSWSQTERNAAQGLVTMGSSGYNAFSRPAAIQSYPLSSSGSPKVYTPGLSYPEQRPSGWYSPPPTLTLNPTAGRGFGSPWRKNRKASRKNRKGSRKNRKASRKNRKGTRRSRRS